MKKLTTILAATTASLALAACGSSTDASEDAMADTVEMPADQALADTPEPVADEEVAGEEAAVEEAGTDGAGMDAIEAAEAAEELVEEDLSQAADLVEEVVAEVEDAVSE